MVSRFQQHNQVSLMMLQASYLSEDTVLAAKIAKSLKKDLEQQLAYYASLDEEKESVFEYIDGRGNKRGDKNDAERMLMQMQALEEHFKRPAKVIESPGQITSPPIKADSPKKGN